MLLFIQLYAILFYLAIGNASLMLLINLLTYVTRSLESRSTRAYKMRTHALPQDKGYLM